MGIGDRASTVVVKSDTDVASPVASGPLDHRARIYDAYPSPKRHRGVCQPFALAPGSDRRCTFAHGHLERNIGRTRRGVRRRGGGLCLRCVDGSITFWSAGSSGTKKLKTIDDHGVLAALLPFGAGPGFEP